MMLEVKNLKKVYKVKNGKPVYALNDVSLKFPETGLVFILGKSGSGKSTLLNVMGGLDIVDDGEIIINGKSSKEFSGNEMDSYRNTYLGFIFQEYNILNDFTVKENIGLALQLQHKKADDEEINKILEQVDLAGLGKRKPNELSGGQKQRVAIARALVKEPKIIFGDEPTGALDSNTGKQVFETLKKLSKEKLVVIVSHDRDFAEHFGDRVIELRDGKVISDISKTSVKSQKPKEGISVIGDNVIKIDRNHALTVDDLTIINAALANRNADTFITADEHVNDAICEAARIDKSGNREEFFTTKPEEIQEGTGYFEAIPSKFSLKNAFKMGGKSLKVKPFRLIMTILLSAVSFTLFGVSITASLFNTGSALSETAKKNQITSVNIGGLVKNGDGIKSQLTDEMKNTLISTYHGDLCTINNIYSDFTSFFTNDAKSELEYLSFYENPYYLYRLENGIVLDQNFLDKTNYQLIGSLPTNNDEVVLPLHLFESFQDFGFKDNINPEQSLSPSLQTQPSDILNRYVTLNNGIYKITGFLDTKFPQELKDEYKRKKILLRDNPNLESLLYEAKSNPLNNCVFFNSTVTFSSEINYYQTLYSQQYSRDFRYDYYQDHQNAYFFDTTKTTLNDNEALINPYGLFSLLEYYTRPDDQTTKELTLENSEMNFDGFQFTDPIKIFSYDDRNNVTSYQLPQAALNKVTNLNYLTFKDHQDFKPFYENRLAGFNYYYDRTYFNYETDSYSYPWETNPNYELNEEDKQIIYNHFKFYVQQVVDNQMTTNEFYTKYLEALTSYQDLYKKEFPPKPSDYYGLYNQVETTIQEKHIEQYGQELYDRYKNDIYFKYFYNQSNNSDEAEKIKETTWNIYNQHNKHFAPYIQNYLTEVRTAQAQFFKENLSSQQPLKLQFLDSDKSNSSNLDITIVGVDLDAYNDYNCLLSLTENKKNILASNYSYDSKTYLYLLPSNDIDFNAFFQEFARRQKEYASTYQYDKLPADAWWFTISNQTLSQIYYLSTTLSILTQVFFYVGLGLAVFAIFLFYNFISISINNKKREIGILRAVGAKRSDVFKIFYSESFIIATINFIIAAVATFILSIVLNNIFQEQAKVDFSIMNPSAIVFLIILGLSLFVSIIAALIPVTRLANKKPIDAINNR